MFSMTTKIRLQFLKQNLPTERVISGTQTGRLLLSWPVDVVKWRCLIIKVREDDKDTLSGINAFLFSNFLG